MNKSDRFVLLALAAVPVGVALIATVGGNDLLGGDGLAFLLIVMIPAVFIFFLILAVHLIFAPSQKISTSSTATYFHTKIARIASVCIIGATFLNLFLDPLDGPKFFFLAIILALWIRGVDSFIISIRESEDSYRKLISKIGLAFILIGPIIIFLLIRYHPNFNNLFFSQLIG